MLSRYSIKWLRLAGFALIAAALIDCRTTPAADPALPVDPAVLVGRLDNGLTYYVRANSRPQNTAELRLVVNAGSVLEDDDQRGLAHFVEHMAFNGTAALSQGRADPPPRVHGHRVRARDQRLYEL